MIHDNDDDIDETTGLMVENIVATERENKDVFESYFHKYPVFREICTYTLEAFGVALLTLTAMSAAPDISGTSVVSFTTAFVLSMLLLATIQYHTNTTNNAQIYGLPLLFVLGMFSKVMVVATDLTVVVMLRAVHVFDMGNPHPHEPLTMYELMIRIVIACVFFIGVLEEMMRFHILRLALSWSMVRPAAYLHVKKGVGVVLMALAISLGGTSWNVMKYLYISDSLLPFYFTIPWSVMEVALNVATALIVGSMVAHSLRCPDKPHPSVWKVVAPAVLFRSLFFCVQMLPLRYRSNADEELEATHLYHHVTKVMFTHHHFMPNYDIGSWYVGLYVVNFVIVVVAFAVGANRFDRIPTHLPGTAPPPL